MIASTSRSVSRRAAMKSRLHRARQTVRDRLEEADAPFVEHPSTTATEHDLV